MTNAAPGRPAKSITSEEWPALPLAEWKDTYATLHMWMQIVGKVRLALTPLVNHWWNVPFHLTARGLTTTPMKHEGGVLEIEFDFVDHELRLRADDGHEKALPLFPRSVADFYKEFMETLGSMGVHVHMWPMPVEIPDPIRFDQDTVHASYDAKYVDAFWRILLGVDPIFEEFRSRFVGKCSPVHFFWGSFDFCVTRFSGRRAPERPGADRITREAYSHEVISAGWWPGGGKMNGPAFYVYAVPEPKDFSEAKVLPAGAQYNRELGEFIFTYDDMRAAPSPRDALLDFLQSTYDAGADLGNWTVKRSRKNQNPPRRQLERRLVTSRLLQASPERRQDSTDSFAPSHTVFLSTGGGAMRYIVRRRQRSAWKGLLAGLAGGLAASWSMNQAQKLLAKAAKARSNGQGSSEEEDITGTTADIIYHAVSGKRLSRDGRRTGGSVVHYAFGTAMGGAYGVAAEVLPRVKAFGGLPYGALLFAGADEAALPLLKLSKKPDEYPVSTHLYALSSHFVYGATVEGVRRLVRRLIR